MQKKHMRAQPDIQTYNDAYTETPNHGKTQQLATGHHRKSKQKRSRRSTNHNPSQKRQPLRPLQRSPSSVRQNPMPNNGKSQLFPQKRTIDGY